MAMSRLKVVHAFFFLARTVLWNVTAEGIEIKGRNDVLTNICVNGSHPSSGSPANFHNKFRRFSQDRKPSEPNSYLGFRMKSIQNNLAGQHLQATAIQIEPSVVLDGNGTPLGGYGYELLRNSAKVYNFTYTLEIPKFAGTVRLKNGSFLGPIGQVSSGQKDLILVCGQTLERNAQLDFTSYLEVTELKFITSPTFVHLAETIIWKFNSRLGVIPQSTLPEVGVALLSADKN